MYSLSNLGLGLAAMAAAEAFEVSATTGAFGSGDKALMNLNRGYARAKKLAASPKKSAAVLKRRKANKQASKQRKSK